MALQEFTDPVKSRKDMDESADEYEVHVVVTFKQGNSSNNLSLRQLHAQ